MKVRDLVGLDALIRADESAASAMISPSADAVVSTPHGVVSGSPLLPAVVISPPVQAVGVASARILTPTPTRTDLHVIGRLSMVRGVPSILWRDGAYLPLLFGPPEG